MTKMSCWLLGEGDAKLGGLSGRVGRRRERLASSKWQGISHFGCGTKKVLSFWVLEFEGLRVSRIVFYRLVRSNQVRASPRHVAVLIK